MPSSALPGRRPRARDTENALRASEAITWFGRAIGAARSGELPKAKEAVDQLGGLKDKLAKANDAYWRGQVAIQEQAAGAWLALAEGRKGEAIAAMRQARTRRSKSASMSRWKIASHRCGNCSASCCSKRRAGPGSETNSKRRNEYNPNRYRSFAGAAKAAERAGKPGRSQHLLREAGLACRQRDYRAARSRLRRSSTSRANNHQSAQPFNVGGHRHLYGTRGQHLLAPPARQPGKVEAAGAKALCERDAEPLGHIIIHSVTNPIPRLTGGLHVCGGDLFDPTHRSEWDPETLRKGHSIPNARFAVLKSQMQFFANGQGH